MLSFAAVTITIAAGAYFLLGGYRKPRHPFPPGPRGVPLIGNLIDMPLSNPWEKFSKWSGLYGDVVYVEVLGRPIILLNLAKSTTHLLEKRATIYSDRLQFPLIDLIGHQWNFAFKPYGKDSPAKIYKSIQLYRHIALIL
ncbi:hypothetical protein DFH07DRAFT_470877 [Mycena maculata]|uniref:Cytochrome P450 n=1 Tax=Mycena maculata TaxID=230809 RepID=A0AAD7J4F7_9AGAR|nr:hypothetical protein DFH07DRAFT_470877 [Mycena maculata]